MTDWIPILVLVLSTLSTGLGYGIKLLWDIREHLAKLNGRITTCEALRKAHEENDEKRHDQCESRIETVERKLMGT